MTPVTAAVVLAASFVAMLAAHEVADHWLQTEWQVVTKGCPGWAGRRACFWHVAMYVITAWLFLFAAGLFTGVTVAPWRVVVALAVSGLTHYIADRRAPLRRLAAWTQHAEFYDLGAPRPGRDDNPTLGTGAYKLDQSYHVLWLFIAALIIA